MSTYTALSSRARALIGRKGGLVTFTRGGSGSAYDPATDTWSGAPALAVTAPAVEVRTNPQMLIAQELVLTAPITLVVSASALAPFVPQPVDAFTWAVLGYTVKWVQNTAPDGVSIIYRITGSR